MICFEATCIISSYFDSDILFTLPPDPLHVNLLGCGNDSIEGLENLFPDVMTNFYRAHNMNKSGQMPGGKFNGPSIKYILRNFNKNILCCICLNFLCIIYMNIIDFE